MFPSRDFISIKNLVIIIDKIIKKTSNDHNSNRIFNVGSGNSTSILKIIKGLEKIYRKDFNIKYRKISKNELNNKANVLKLKKFIRFNPKNNLKNILLSHYGKFY